MATKPIHKIIKDGEEIYPITASDAVLCGDEETENLKNIIKELQGRIDELEKKTQGLDTTGNFIDKVSAPGGFFMK